MNDPTVIQLCRLEVAERRFAQAYDQAIAKISDPYVRQQLEECQRSHQMRVDILTDELDDLGGELAALPSEPLIDPDRITESNTIAELEAVEDANLAFLRSMVPDGDFDVRDLIEGDLLPEQERTHAIITSLKDEG